MTPDTLAKLEMAFSMDCSILEACLVAGIARDTYYDYLKVNPAFADRAKLLRVKPLLKARTTIVQSLDDVKAAQWYAERKAKGEFAQRKELTGKDGKPIESRLSREEMDDEALKSAVSALLLDRPELAQRLMLPAAGDSENISNTKTQGEVSNGTGTTKTKTIIGEPGAAALGV